MKIKVFMFIIAFFAICAIGKADTVIIIDEQPGCTVSGSTSTDQWAKEPDLLTFTVPGCPGCSYSVSYETRGNGQNFEFQVLGMVVVGTADSNCKSLSALEVQNAMLLAALTKHHDRIDQFGTGDEFMIKMYKGTCAATIRFGEPGPEGPIKLKIPMSKISVDAMTAETHGIIMSQVDGETDDSYLVIVQEAKLPCGSTICCQSRFNVKYNSNGSVKKYVFVDSFADQNVVCTPHWRTFFQPCETDCPTHPSNWPDPLPFIIKASPNPSNGIISLNINDGYTGLVTYEVVDINGNVVASGTISLNNGNADLNLSFLTTGTYKIRFKNQAQTIGTGSIIIN